MRRASDKRRDDDNYPQILWITLWIFPPKNFACFEKCVRKLEQIIN